jgi:hypothetical protein
MSELRIGESCFPLVSRIRMFMNLEFCFATLQFFVWLTAHTVTGYEYTNIWQMKHH